MKMKTISHYLVLSMLSVFSVAALAAYDVRMVGIVFDDGADKIEIDETISGDESVMYRFRPREGQFLRVRLNPDNDHTDFIVYAPGKWPGEVLHDSEASGSFEYEGRIDETGPHAVSVFQSQGAVTEGLTAEYRLVIEVTDALD